MRVRVCVCVCVCVCVKKSIKAVFTVARCLFIFGTLGFYWQTPGLMRCLLAQQYVPDRLIYWIGGLVWRGW